MKIIAKYKIFESIYDKYDGDIIDKLCNINSQFDEIRDNLKKELLKKFEDLNIYSIYFDDETGDTLYNGTSQSGANCYVERIEIFNNGIRYNSEFLDEFVTAFEEPMNEYFIWNEAMKKDATNISISYLYYDDSRNFKNIYDKINFNEFIEYKDALKFNKERYRNSKIIEIFKTYEFQKFILDNYEDAYILFKQFIDPKIEIEYPFITNMSNIGLI